MHPCVCVCVCVRVRVLVWSEKGVCVCGVCVNNPKTARRERVLCVCETARKGETALCNGARVVFPGWANEVKSHVGEARRREPESGCSFEIAGHGEGKLTEARDVGVLLLEHACKEGENRLA